MSPFYTEWWFHFNGTEEYFFAMKVNVVILYQFPTDIGPDFVNPPFKPSHRGTLQAGDIYMAGMCWDADYFHFCFDTLCVKFEKKLKNFLVKMEYCNNPVVKTPESLMSEAGIESRAFERRGCKLTQYCERFRLKDRNYMRQYAHLYSERLITMRGKLEKSARAKWGNDTILIAWQIFLCHLNLKTGIELWHN